MAFRSFGHVLSKPWPTSSDDFPELTRFGKKLLTDCEKIEKPKKNVVNAEDIIKSSSEFPVPFPINSCRVMAQPKDRYPAIAKQAASAYPIIHERVLALYLSFLEYKCEYGTEIEKAIYQNLTLSGFIQRLLSKRCVTFYNRNDKYLLLSGEKGASGFVEIGTDNEKFPLIFRNCLSYDEMKLSALLSVSSYSEFLNDGNRKNAGVPEKNLSKIERCGVIIGLIGARLSRRDLMEFQDIIISKSQNTVQNGYGPKDVPLPTSADIIAKKKRTEYRKIWNQLYEEEDVLFENAKIDGERFGHSKNKADIFDNLMMKKRYTLSIDTLLLESEARCAESGKRGYIHVVGIGLGVWRTAAHQEEIFLETFGQRLNELMALLNHVSFVHFSWFTMIKCGPIEHDAFLKSASGSHPDGGIRLFVSKRNPADKLIGPDFDNTELIVSYAWDGNALPGNEFWMGMLTSTGDPAAACSTLITELHNPHINREMVSGDNLHIATPRFGVIHIADYAKRLN